MDKQVRLSVTWEAAKKWLRNALFFTAPALIVFFEALRQGVEPKKALYILVIGLYGLIVDALRKIISVEPVQKAAPPAA